MVKVYTSSNWEDELKNYRFNTIQQHPEGVGILDGQAAFVLKSDFDRAISLLKRFVKKDDKDNAPYVSLHGETEEFLEECKDATGK